jgi:hypothetical protein
MLHAAKSPAISQNIAFKGNGDSGPSVCGGRNAANAISPANSNVTRLPTIARTALTRIPIHLCIVMPV